MESSEVSKEPMKDKIMNLYDNLEFKRDLPVKWSLKIILWRSLEGRSNEFIVKQSLELSPFNVDVYTK